MRNVLAGVLPSLCHVVRRSKAMSMIVFMALLLQKCLKERPAGWPWDFDSATV